MYKLTFNVEGSKILKTLKLDNLEDIVNTCEKQKEVKRFNLADVFDNVNYGINILEPTEDGDSIFIYATETFWDYFSPNLHEYLVGRRFNQVFTKFVQYFGSGDNIQHVLSNNRMDVILKLYENDKLIKVWSQLNIEQGGLLYSCFLDKTDFYLAKEKEKTIFENSAFPILSINKKGEVLKTNKSFKNLLGYNSEELNEIGLDNIVDTFNTTDLQVDNILSAIKLVFDKNLESNYSDLGLITKNGGYKWVKAHIRLITDDLAQITLQNVTEETLIKKEALKLRDNFALIQGLSKMFIAEYDGEKYSFTSEAYTILELNPEEFDDTVNIVEKAVLPEDMSIWRKFNTLTPEDSDYQLTFRVKTGKGNIKHLYAQNMAKFDENGKLQKIIGFLQDVTEERIAMFDALRLQDNFNIIQETSKVVLCLLENGKYSYTPEIYNILAISPDEYPDNVEVVGEYIIPEDMDLYDATFVFTPEHPDVHETLGIKNAKGELIYIRTHNRAIFDDDGNLIRVLGFIQDITEEKLAQLESSHLTNNFNLIQSASKIFLAEYKYGKFSFTQEAYTIFEINPEDFTDKDDLINLYMIPEDNEQTIKPADFGPGEHNYHNEFRIKTGKGNIRYLQSQVRILVDDNGELISKIGFIQDVTDETIAKESALDLQRSLSIIQSASKIVIDHVKDGKYIWTSEIYDILEISPDDYPKDIDLISLFTVPEDVGKIDDVHVHLTPENPDGHNLATIITPKGNKKVLEGFLKAQFDDNGELIETICFIHEITSKVEREHELLQLSEDRKILLQEVHHRVKNNLQLILSFLSLESRYNQDNPEYVIEQTKNRISAMALTHEEVYQSPNVSEINLETFLTREVTNLFNNYTNGHINLNFDIEPIEVDIDKGIPLSLLINEVALNTIKYAFPNNGYGNFYVNLKLIDEDIVLKLWDDGVGLPESVDLFDGDTLGFIIIRNLTQQLEGDLTIMDNINGFGLKLVFKS